MTGADWALLGVLALGAVIGFSSGSARWTPFALGFTIGILVSNWPANHVEIWVSHQFLHSHASVDSAANAGSVAHFCIAILIALAVGAICLSATHINQEHWRQAYSFKPFTVVGRGVGALNGALVLTLVGTEVALLLAATMASIHVDDAIVHSAMLAPTARLFHLTVP